MCKCASVCVREWIHGRVVGWCFPYQRRAERKCTVSREPGHPRHGQYAIMRCPALPYRPGRVGLVRGCLARHDTHENRARVKRERKGEKRKKRGEGEKEEEERERRHGGSDPTLRPRSLHIAGAAAPCPCPHPPALNRTGSPMAWQKDRLFFSLDHPAYSFPLTSRHSSIPRTTIRRSGMGGGGFDAAVECCSVQGDHR